MRIVVTGGRGDLGGRVVRELGARGHDAVPASRRTGVDLSTGDGVDAVLDDADAVVHAASSQTRPQTVDIDWVARRLADDATGPAPSGYRRATDLAGPTAYTAPEVAALLAVHDGRPAPRVVRVPPVLPVLKGFSEGAILPGPDAETGGRTFEEWLVTQPVPLPRRFHSPT